MTGNQVAYAGVQVQKERVQLEREVAQETARHNVSLESLTSESNRIAEEYNIQRNVIEQQKADTDRWYKEESIKLAGQQNELTRLRDQYTYEVSKIKAQADTLNAQTNAKMSEIEASKAEELQRHNVEMENYNTRMAENQTYANETQRKIAYYNRLAASESYEIGLKNAQANMLKAESDSLRAQFQTTTQWEFEKKVELSSEIRNWYSAVTHAHAEKGKIGLNMVGLVSKIAETAVMAGGL